MVYYLLEKDGVRYKTTSRLYYDVAIKVKGYRVIGKRSPKHIWDIKLLPFKLTKIERDKYKVVLRLMR